MSIGTNISVITVGAILTFATRIHASGIRRSSNPENCRTRPSPHSAAGRCVRVDAAPDEMSTGVVAG